MASGGQPWAAALALSALFATVAIADGNPYPRLDESIDPDLQSAVQELVGRMGLNGPVGQQNLALVLADITDPTRPRVASLNGDRMMYAASLPKIAILYGAFRHAQEEGLEFDAALEEDITRMIRVSSNDAATRVLEWVGRDALIEMLKAPDVRFYDPARGGGLWVGKDYARANAYRRDPLYNLSHGATAMQAARFYYLLETDRLVSPEACRAMKEALAEPGISHKFVAGLAQRPGARIYRKSGTWREYHADSALVEVGSRRLIMTGLVQDPQGGKWLEQLAAPLYDLIVHQATDGRMARRKCGAGCPSSPRRSDADATL